MPTSDDNDLDDLLRTAMKTLDAEAPSGYFEALPDVTLARLEGTMQHGPQGTMDDPVSAPPPVGDNTEDSGLHDIRNLAHSTKQRLSSRRITVNPTEVENDVIASSSAGWKAVALPQPAKMVALPELTELPSRKEVIAKEKAAAKAAKAEAKAEAKTEAKSDAKVEKAAEVAAAVEAPAAAAPTIGKKAYPQQPGKSKTGLYAAIGIAVAAAAGAAIFVGTRGSKDASPQVAQNTAAPVAAPAAPTVTPIATGSSAVSADVQAAQDELAKQQAEAERLKAELAAAQAAAPAETKADDSKGEKAPVKTKAHTEKVETPVKKTEETKPAPDKVKEIKKPEGTKSGDSAEPDFNELLKEAGVKDQEKKKPVLAKKELTGDDFKTGINAVKPAAKSCYKGTQGTAMTKIVIAPSGKISKVTVTGQFAGTPEGECVASAIKGATFPAWDGGPASFSYPILLSE
jgi:hypothetical protein